MKFTNGIKELPKGGGITVALINKGNFEWLPHLLFSIRSWRMIGAGKIAERAISNGRDISTE